MIRKCIIFGGSGFIGSHFASFLISNKYFDEIYLADIKSPISQKVLNDKKIKYFFCDVRNKITLDLSLGNDDLIANFAAIHREPGHEDYEYYETNLPGAENICRWAGEVQCNNILFTSSISPYGVSESIKDEKTLPNPSTAYGASKLIAEKIHQIWQAQDPSQRLLQIVRPGVVFGSGEGGNVTRLINAVIHNYFFYMGNKATRKSGVYVKELCFAMHWMINYQKETKKHFALYNMSMNPGPSIQEYVLAVCKVLNIKKIILNIPFWILLSMSYLIETIARPLSIKHPFSPVRIKKLIRSNNILPNFLIEHGYEYQYSLEEAFKDWKAECPSDWS